MVGKAGLCSFFFRNYLGFFLGSFWWFFCILFFLKKLLSLWFITGCWVEFPVLYSRTLLFLSLFFFLLSYQFRGDFLALLEV